MEHERRIPKEHTFATFDGPELFYRHWKGNGKRAIIVFHRSHEHSGRLQDVVDALGMPEYDCFPWAALPEYAATRKTSACSSKTPTAS